MEDCSKKGRFNPAKGSSSNFSLLSETQVRLIRLDNRLLREIAKDYGCTKENIGQIRAGKTWKHLK